MARKRLREGFTTGTAATAAAKAALLALLGRGRHRSVEVPLPREGRLTIPVDRISLRGEEADAEVVKDGGDDPDATHRARIRAVVRLGPREHPARVLIDGGTGVGRVTRAGLPVPVGEAAINPAPRLQIEAGIREALKEAGAEGEVRVLIEVEDGERIARKTLNPRLGIVGGISILGTRGTVKPFSNKAYRDTIAMSLNVARSQGLREVALATGGKSERLLKELQPGLPDTARIQVADFFAFSLREAVKHGMASVHVACFFGKLVKMAQGHPYTHARRSRIDFSDLAAWCGDAGLDPKRIDAVSHANTSREALDVIRQDPASGAVMEEVLKRATCAARAFLGPGPRLAYYLFDFDESLLGTCSDEPVIEGEPP
jgi:cobalt-precorrin-5B (C1)-methyltransferase